MVRFLKVIGFLPVIFVLALVFFTYYTYVFVFITGLFTVSSQKILAVVLFIIYHPVLILFLWSLYQAVFADPGGVPHSYSNEIESVGYTETKRNGSRRYCNKCEAYKPDRCHHCSICDRCILKMDHHCPWINNCVGFYNHKFFVLFVFYGCLLSFVLAITILPFLINTDRGMDAFFLLLTFLIAAMFFFALLGFFAMHANLVLKNGTTIEGLDRYRKTKNIYDLGRKKNFESVFGTDPYYWLIPLRRSARGDGVFYETNVKDENENTSLSSSSSSN